MPRLWYISLLYRNSNKGGALDFKVQLVEEVGRGGKWTSPFCGKNARLWELGQGKVFKELTPFFRSRLKLDFKIQCHADKG